MDQPIVNLNHEFNVEHIVNCLPKAEFSSGLFHRHNQLSLTHSASSDDWYDGVGSLYDFEQHKFKASTSDFSIINSFFTNSYIETVINTVKNIALQEDNVLIGRIRLAQLNSKTCYSLHTDPEDFRYHIPLFTNPKCFFVVDNQICRMETTGCLYKFKTSKEHTAVNASFKKRVHLIFDTYANQSMDQSTYWE